MSEETPNPEIRLASSADGLGIVLMIANLGPVPLTIMEPHPHTSVRLYDPDGRLFDWHYGVFAAFPRWQVTLQPDERCQRIVILPRFFLAARGKFDAVCTVEYRVGEPPSRPMPSREAAERPQPLTVRGAVELALPSVEEFDSEAGEAHRARMQQYERAGFVYPLPAGV
jgi:hypothetical protein